MKDNLGVKAGNSYKSIDNVGQNISIWWWIGISVILASYLSRFRQIKVICATKKELKEETNMLCTDISVNIPACFKWARGWQHHLSMGKHQLQTGIDPDC